jgi:hypothetical protein
MLGVLLIFVAVSSLYFQRLGISADGTVFMLITGGIFCFGGGVGLLMKAEWEINIDETHLSWHGQRSGEDIPIHEIVRVRVEEGNWRLLVVDTKDGKTHKIPGECYGDASELRLWFRQHLGNRFQVF